MPPCRDTQRPALSTTLILPLFLSQLNCWELLSLGMLLTLSLNCYPKREQYMNSRGPSRLDGFRWTAIASLRKFYAMSPKSIKAYLILNYFASYDSVDYVSTTCSWLLGKNYQNSIWILLLCLAHNFWYHLCREIVLKVPCIFFFFLKVSIYHRVCRLKVWFGLFYS